MKYRTHRITLEGAICGPLWWPVDDVAGKPLHVDLARVRDRFSTHDTEIRDLLISVQCAEGGDFQGADFTADTRIVIERVAVDGNYRRSHVREIDISKYYQDLVTDDYCSGDFCEY